MQPRLVLVYSVLAIASVSASLAGGFPGYPILKALPIWILAYLVLRSRRNELITAGLLFGSAGDIVLALEFPLSFVIGLGLFLVGHLFYVVAFARTYRIQKDRTIWVIIPVIFCGVMLVFLSPKLDALAIPVYAYMAVILAMVITSVYRDGPAIPLVIGTYVFMISDSLIAVNKFLTPLPLAAISILGTYYLAQLLIAMDALKDAGPRRW